MEHLLTRWNMVWLFALATCFVSAETAADSDSFRYKGIAKALRKFQPALNTVRSVKLAKIFLDTSMESDCNIPWQILASVAFHESSLGQNTYNAKSGDFGLMQVNYRMIRRLNLDLKKIKSDATYAVRAACKILRFNRDTYSKHRPYWIGIYRSGTKFSNPKIILNAISYTNIITLTANKLLLESAPKLATSSI